MGTSDDLAGETGETGEAREARRVDAADAVEAGVVREVVRTARRNPGLLPADAARLTVARLGPRVATADLEASKERITTRTVRAVDTEGAFVGGPLLVLVPLAFCAALLRQLRGVLELAALAGRDPAAPERAVELLLIQGAYEDAEAAREAIAAAGAVEGPVGGGAAARRRGGFGGWWELGMRAARLLGLLTPDQARSRWAQVGGWLLVSAVFVVGFVAPLVWLPYMAWSYDRATRRLMDRAASFYLGEGEGEGGGEEAPPEPDRRRVDPALVGALARGLLSLLVALGLVVFAVLTDLKIFGTRWPVLALLLATSAVVTGCLWLRRRRQRRGTEG